MRQPFASGSLAASTSTGIVIKPAAPRVTENRNYFIHPSPVRVRHEFLVRNNARHIWMEVSRETQKQDGGWKHLK